MEIRRKSLQRIILTLHVEVVAVPYSGLKKDTDREGKLGIALITESGEREVLVRSVIDSEVAHLSLSESVLISGLDHSLDLWFLLKIIERVFSLRGTAVTHVILS